jgi:CRISPR-associated protein Csb2
VHVSLGMDNTQRRVMERLERIWSRDGGAWRLVLEDIGNASSAAPFGSARAWQSVTPYLHPWHRKKHLDVADQIARECRQRGLPDPVMIEQLNEVLVGHRLRRPIHFHRFRSRRGLSQPDRQGGFWRLTFPETVTGPLALGFACHFGLGLFAPVTK